MLVNGHRSRIEHLIEFVFMGILRLLAAVLYGTIELGVWGSYSNACL